MRRIRKTIIFAIQSFEAHNVAECENFVLLLGCARSGNGHSACVFCNLNRCKTHAARGGRNYNEDTDLTLHSESERPEQERTLESEAKSSSTQIARMSSACQIARLSFIQLQDKYAAMGMFDFAAKESLALAAESPIGKAAIRAVDAELMEQLEKSGLNSFVDII